MLDPYVRPIIDPPLNFVGKAISSLSISANAVTVLGLVFGLVAIALVATEQYTAAVVFFCINRFLDGVDGAVARHSELSDFGGLLDIVCDFVVYSGIVFAFGIANPDNLFYAALLIFSFIGPISSFLAYATIAAKKQKNCTKRGHKSFYYLGGICEGTETAAVLILMCLFPNQFAILCVIYSILCWLTTAGRVYNAWVDFASN